MQSITWFWGTNMFLDWYGNGLFPNFSFTGPPPVTRMSKWPSDLVRVNPSLKANPLDTLTPLNPWPEGVRTLPLITETFLNDYKKYENLIDNLTFCKIVQFLQIFVVNHFQ